MLDPTPCVETLDLSADQASAWETLSARLGAHGIDLSSDGDHPVPEADGNAEVLAVIGKAGSGKTVLLAQLARALRAAGIDPVTAEDAYRRRHEKRSFAVLAPTNKAVSVLRGRGVPASTLHRIMYTPVYDPEYQKVADWLEGERKSRPEVEGLTAEAMDKAKAAFDTHGSVAGALAAAGLRGSDFITGWKRREDPLDIALVDEASMVDSKQLEDLAEIFRLIVLFGDPAQLAPVGERGAMVFETLPAGRQFHLSRIHRQAADNPILDLAHALADPDLEFHAFERMIDEAAARDERVVVAPRADPDLMTTSPMLVWRNKTRIRLIAGFRHAHNVPPGTLVTGEPLVCDGLELPLKQRKHRAELESHGLVKGAHARYRGPGRKPNYARVDVVSTEEGPISVAAIIQVEQPEGEALMPAAARMGAMFLHGAAVTIHKAQGSQWPRVQVFAPDLFAAARAGQSEAGIALWKRLAYVAITRAEEQLIWVRRAALARPEAPLAAEIATPAAAAMTAGATAVDNALDGATAGGKAVAGVRAGGEDGGQAVSPTGGAG
ncbi:MAG: AAA family ATPase [Pseudomonadota bacterium]